MIAISDSDNQSSDCIEREEISVYVTKYGKCYHPSDCHSLKKSKISISYEEAKERYLACSICSLD